MDKHADLILCVKMDGDLHPKEILNIIYGKDGVEFKARDVKYTKVGIYEIMTFNTSLENIIRILQDERIINLLYR